MIDWRTPSEKVLSHDASTLEQAAGGPIDVAITLGSGLSSALRDRFTHRSVPYDELLGIPVAPLRGHAGEALVGTWGGKRVVAFAGRVHLYQGFSAQQVTMHVRLAKAAGAATMIVTNAAGGLNTQFVPGDIMAITDHINLTGRNPLIGLPLENPFTDLSTAYDPALIEAVRNAAQSQHRLREGVYAGLLGPTYETPAEARYLRTIGADAVGMSTVLETILARTLEMRVLGLSLITNIVAAPNTSHAEVTAVGAEAASRVADLLEAAVHAV